MHLLKSIILLCILIAFSACRQKGTDKIMISNFSKKVIYPQWESSEWEDPDCIMIESQLKGSENKMHTYSVWDKDSLWFFFKVSDTDLRSLVTEKDHPRLYLDDMVEILFDTQCRKDSCWDEDDIVYHVNIMGYKKDDKGTPECKTNPLWDGNAGIKIKLFGTINDSLDTDKGYLMNLSFNWDELGVKPARSLKMGINFANGDNDGTGRHLFDWSGAWPMRSPYAFGDIILK